MAVMNKVKPYFGFQQHADFWLEVAQKTLHCKRVVIGQINAQHTVAVKLFAGFAASGRGVGEQNLMIWVGRLQALHQAGRSPSFANRDGMQPDDRLVAINSIKPKALRDMLQVPGLFACPPCQMEKNVGQ